MDQTHTIVFDARMAERPFSGIQRYSHSLIRAMAPLLREDERLHLILPPGPSEWAPASPRVFIHSAASPAPSFRSHCEAGSMERRLGAQVAHSPSAFTPIRVPGRLVLTVHDMMPFSNPGFHSAWFRLLWRLSALRAILRARRIIAASEAALATYSKYVSRNTLARSSVILPGVDGAFRPQGPARIEEARRAYGLPEKFLLYVGSDEPHKNLSTLLEAFAGQDPTACCPLVIAGFGAEGSVARRRADELGLGGRVVWPGPIAEKDLPAIYSAAHAFCFPSLVEGFCFPVLEAMACGTPVICSALKVLTEMTGGAATLVHPTDLQEWSRAIQSAVVSLTWREACRGKGLERAGKFSWSRAAEQTLAVYRQLYPKRAQTPEASAAGAQGEGK